MVKYAIWRKDNTAAIWCNSMREARRKVRELRGYTRSYLVKHYWDGEWLIFGSLREARGAVDDKGYRKGPADVIQKFV